MRKIFGITLVITLILVVVAIGQISYQPLSPKTETILNSGITPSPVQPNPSNAEPNSKQNTVVCDNFPTRTEIENCLGNELNTLNSKLDDEINNYSKEIKAFYSAKDLLNLIKSQKSWLSYRQENCRAEKELYGLGTDAVQAELSCQINLTYERGEELRRIYGQK